MERKPRTTKYAIEINGELFSSGTALKDRLRTILDKYIWDGCPSDVELSDEDSSFFVCLVRARDAGRIPEGDYIRSVVRTSRDGQIGRHVKFVYGCGTEDMIGWAKLCAGRRNRSQEVTDAMRQSVAAQMMRAYSKAFSATHADLNGGIVISSGVIVCPKSGRRLSVTGEFADDTAVVHHDGESFFQLRDRWLEQAGYTAETLPLVDLEIGGCSIAPGDVRDSWESFHAMNATLVVVSKKWHDEHHIEERRTKQEARDVIAATAQDG